MASNPSNTTYKMSSCPPDMNATSISEPRFHGDNFYALGYMKNTFATLKYCCQSNEVALFDEPLVNMTTLAGCYSYCNITKPGLETGKVKDCVEESLEQVGLGVVASIWENSTEIHNNDTTSSTPTTTATKTPVRSATSAPTSGSMSVKGNSLMGYAVMGLACSSAFAWLL